MIKRLLQESSTMLTGLKALQMSQSSFFVILYCCYKIIIWAPKILVLNIHQPYGNSGRHHISKQESNSMLTLSREKRFLKEIIVKREPHYRRYCRESLRELIMYSCPRIGIPEEDTRYSTSA